MTRTPRTSWTSLPLPDTAVTLGAGAALMYYFDPERGRRRRKLALDQLRHVVRIAEETLDATGRDVSHRVAGAMAMARSELDYRMYAVGDPDVVLVERVRTQLGRIVTHPRAIHVTAENGKVTLSGPILASEVGKLLGAVRRVRGVRRVEHRLAARRSPGTVPSLQGAGKARTTLPDPFQRTWSPTTRAAATATGVTLAATGLGRGGPIGLTAGAAGAALLARALSNMELERIFGLQGRRGVDVHKTINITAPVNQVHEFWSRFENFPRFMSHVVDVHDLGEGRSHWTVAGPAGAPIRWMAEVTRAEPNEMIAWKSVAGALVSHAGIVHFRENPDRSTQIDVQLTYSPPAGLIGHAVAAFFGSDPKRAMDEDLVRLKSLLEDGKATAHGHSVRLEELATAV